MPRPIVGRQATSSDALGQRRDVGTASGSGRILQSARSRRYLDALGRMDGRTALTPVQTAAIADGIRREFDEKWCSTPLAILAICYLGHPFEVHTLTQGAAIIEHYRSADPLPAHIERARPLARSDKFACIEIYPDRLVAVMPDGTAAVVGSST
jgi:hypothetical protein